MERWRGLRSSRYGRGGVMRRFWGFLRSCRKDYGSHQTCKNTLFGPVYGPEKGAFCSPRMTWQADRFTGSVIGVGGCFYHVANRAVPQLQQVLRAWANLNGAHSRLGGSCWRQRAEWGKRVRFRRN